MVKIGFVVREEGSNHPLIELPHGHAISASALSLTTLPADAILFFPLPILSSVHLPLPLRFFVSPPFAPLQAAYLFAAALSELRTELSVRARNDGLALRSTSSLIRREVDALSQKLKEDIGTLKHE